MFQEIYKSIHGDTVSSENVKLDAYKQANYIRNVLDRITKMTFHEDGCITVSGKGIAPITFELISD